MGLKVPFLKPGERFPNPLNARRDGLLAVGNILSPEMVWKPTNKAFSLGSTKGNR